MNSSNVTDTLIGSLARQAGSQPARTPASLERRLALMAVLSLVTAAGLVVLLYGVRSNLAESVLTTPFLHKTLSMLALACGAWLLVRDAALPGGPRFRIGLLLPGVVVLLLGAITDTSGLSLLGRSSRSVPLCVSSIFLVSLPALAMVLGTLRMGAPTRPTLAGATAGLLSGSLGAAAYVLTCRNDAGWFVAIWYSLAVLLVVVVGAGLGRRALAW